MPKKAKVKPLSADQLTEILQKVRAPMHATFEVTASDLEEACAGCGERLTNAGAVESCLDGGGLMSVYGGQAGKDADALIRDYAKAGHYTQIYKHLCKTVRLV